MDHFGSYLKSQREAKNIRLEEIASITKIHLHNLHLLEKGEWNQLPPEPFIRGFIIAYSKYIGLDTKDTVKRFLESRSQESDSSEMDFVEEMSVAPISETQDASEVLKGRRWSVQKVALGIAGVGIIGVIAGVSYVGRRSAMPLAIETLAENEDESPLISTEHSTTPDDSVEKGQVQIDVQKDATAEVSADVATRETATETAPPEPTRAHEVVVEGKERTWMKIVIDDQKPRETFLNEGEIMTLTAYEKIKVVLGNSTGTRVVHNGDVVLGEKFSGTIRSYIFPKNARFPQDPPKRSTTAESEEVPAAIEE